MSRKTKSVLRRTYLGLRRHLPRRGLRLKAKKILDRLEKLLGRTRCHGLCLYRAILNEPDIAGLAGSVGGQRVFFPRVAGRSLEFYGARAARDFQKSPLGIMEPKKRLPFLSEVSFPAPNSVVIFLVPGVVFDTAGGRIGFGKGYYDAYLRGVESVSRFRIFKIGVAWDFQVRSGPLPTDRLDVRMDILVTEKRVIDCLKSS